jgi:uncharacterized membrane protein (DUF2068 family)
MARPDRSENPRTLLLIALFKLLKGVLLVAVGIGALRFLHHDLAEAVMRWVNILRVDPENRFIHAVLNRALFLSPNQLKLMSIGTFFYAALLLTEGIGLLLHKTWAEYFTIVTTAALIPLEIYELIRHVTAAKISVLAINVAIVIYLVARVRSKRVRRRHAPPKPISLPLSVSR